ncbi:ATPase [Flavobacteriaceae bacterium AU392]|nr:ATPase [Flavobacteriaceae bacterium]RKM86471.1 ATPase [Flavobacteriaceae bacterium AU392]
MNTRRIVITGGPASGKTSIIRELMQQNYTCFEEISRQITIDAKEKGIDQLFLTNPILFSKLLLKGRKAQFNKAETISNNIMFYDRGIPDIIAYLNYSKKKYPDFFTNTCKNNTYDTIFILNPWEAIFENDSERYEDFEQAKEIHTHLVNTYKAYEYKLIDVPFDSVVNRVSFILNYLEIN